MIIKEAISLIAENLQNSLSNFKFKFAERKNNIVVDAENNEIYSGISDDNGNFGYLRLVHENLNYKALNLNNDFHTYEITLPLRLVTIGINIDKFRLEAALRNALVIHNWKSFKTNEGEILDIIIQKSNLNFEAIYKEEVGNEFLWNDSVTAVMFDIRVVLISFGNSCKFPEFC